MSSRTAPGELEVLRRFLNSERRVDRLADTASTRQWLQDHELLLAGDAIDARDVESLRRLRSVVAGQIDGDTSDPDAVPTDTVEMEIVFSGGGIRLRPTGPSPAVRAIAALVQIIDRASCDGSLSRLKRCDECHWAFYDSSRNRSRRWCDMAVCGNRVNVQRFRRRQNMGESPRSE